MNYYAFGVFMAVIIVTVLLGVVCVLGAMIAGEEDELIIPIGFLMAYILLSLFIALFFACPEKFGYQKINEAEEIHIQNNITIGGN